jgi:phosphoglycerate dehydrogenase-like enzyme
MGPDREEAMRVAVLDDYQGVAEELGDWQRLAGRAEIEVFRDHLGEPAALIERLRPFEVVCLMRERTPFPRAIIEELPDLKLIVTTGLRNDSIDVAAATERGVLVCGTHSAAHPAAELSFGLILALARLIVPESRSVEEGGWQVGLGRDLKAATLGIVGLGRLGSLVAGYGRAFGMEVIAWSQNLTDERAAEAGARRVEKVALFAEADFVTVHLKLSERTRGIVGAAEIGRMKRDAYLVNTSRGPIVDTGVLVAAVKEGRIAGAALDVFDEEPLAPDDPLRRLPNLLLTPHIGYVTRENYRTFYRETVEAIVAWLDGKPVRAINPEVAGQAQPAQA